MNFYNTFTALLQIEQLLGVWEQAPDDYWTIPRAKRSLVTWPEPAAYQDPYRRLILAQSPEYFHEIINNMNGIMRRGFQSATAFVITYEMTELFINKVSGKAAAQKPAYFGGAGVDETVFHRSTYEENLDNAAHYRSDSI